VDVELDAVAGLYAEHGLWDAAFAPAGDAS
jgi:hypothetical protein